MDLVSVCMYVCVYTCVYMRVQNKISNLLSIILTTPTTNLNAYPLSLCLAGLKCVTVQLKFGIRSVHSGTLSAVLFQALVGICGKCASGG